MSSDKSLSQSELLNQNTTDWVPYEQQKFISHSFEAGKSKIKVPVRLGSGEGPLSSLQTVDSLLCPHMAEGAGEFSAVSF